MKFSREKLLKNIFISFHLDIVQVEILIYIYSELIHTTQNNFTGKAKIFSGMKGLPADL